MTPTTDLFRSLLPWICVVVLGLVAVASYIVKGDR